MQKEQISLIRKNIECLRSNTGRLSSVYADDPVCWKGEAAEEELSYIDADKDDFRRILNEIEACLQELI